MDFNSQFLDPRKPTRDSSALGSPSLMGQDASPYSPVQPAAPEVHSLQPYSMPARPVAEPPQPQPISNPQLLMVVLFVVAIFVVFLIVLLVK
jgi:hypothetical protein